MTSNAAEELGAWRKAERGRLIAAREAMAPEARAMASADIARLLIAHFGAANPGVVACYWPHRGEVDCVPVMRHILDLGGEVALPFVVRPRHPLEFRRWTPQSAMTPGVGGVPHPAEGPPLRPDTLLIPLAGFDGLGFRLGYGGGYYDRTLAGFDHRPKTIGVAFELSRLESVRPQVHDVAMDVVITERGFRLTTAA